MGHIVVDVIDPVFLFSLSLFLLLLLLALFPVVLLCMLSALGEILNVTTRSMLVCIVVHCSVKLES